MTQLSRAEIVRFADEDGPPQVGVRRDGVIRPLRQARTIGDLLSLSSGEFHLRLDDLAPALPDARVRLLPPVDGRTEVWAAGVTYEMSRIGRVEESRMGSVYEAVYDAPRPELFLKAVAWRVVTTGDAVAIRDDSSLDVPEPELAVAVNRYGEIVGYTVCNDMSSREIEAANPLYLPQAKIYTGSCALGPGIVPYWEVEDPTRLTVTMEILRDGAVIWAGQTSTARLHRSLHGLVDVLYHATDFPDGAILATGTGIVPELSFTLQDGDRVDITIDGIGSVSNPVVRGRPPATVGGGPS
jgi:2-dehydro-3-deoxy-D-arabinonate dehydratase